MALANEMAKKAPCKLWRIMLRSNYDEKIVKIKNVIELWQLTRLTLLGKIILIKSVLVSQLIYILTLLPTYAKALQKVNKLLFRISLGQQRRQD